MIGKIVPHLFTPASQNPKKEFDALLKSRDSQKISQFITQNPQLIHQPLSSGYTPIERAIALKNPQSIRVLIERGAKINAANSQGISPFDQLILMQDYTLLSQTFSPYFSEQVKKIDADLKTYIQDPNFTNEVQKQIKTIYTQALRLSQSFEVPIGAQLKSLIEKNNLEAIKADLKTALNQNNYHQIFSAVIYGITNHKNAVIKAAYELIGDDLLSFKTTDLFNLYHIATLFNNADAIRQLDNLGMTKCIEQYSSSFSPYFFAIISPELKTFEALVNSKLPFPASTNLKAYSAGAKDIILSPLQLWIAKAHFVDPMPKISFLAKLNTIFAASNFALQYFSIGPSILLKDLYSLSYFILQTANNLSLFNEKRNWIGSMLLSALTLYLQQSGLMKNIMGLNTTQYFMQTIKFVSVVSIIYKLREELKIYSKTFYYRPLQTVKSFSYKLINYSLNLMFVLKYFESVEVTQSDEEPNNEPSDHDFVLDKKIQDFRDRLALNTKEKTTKEIIQCFGQYNSYNEAQAISPVNYKQPLDCLDYKLNFSENKNEILRAYKALTLYVHPDKCPSAECLIIAKAIAKLANKIKTNNWP